MMKNEIKRAVVVGATSGIGREVAKLLLQDGWTLGVIGRREERLIEFQRLAPERIFICPLDICQDKSDERLTNLIHEMGGMDLYFHSSGVGKQNVDLSVDIEIMTLETNGTGFVRMVTAAYRYFREQGRGHLAIISSIAGVKGLGVAPAYSASKRFQNTYIDALEQLSRIRHIPITFTDIRPGFVATDLLSGSKSYPMLMNTEKVALQIFKALRCKKRRVVIDWKYRILVFFWKLIPAWLWKRLPIHN